MILDAIKKEMVLDLNLIPYIIVKILKGKTNV